MAIMYITHNLGVIAQMTENVIVMYMGKIVEQADVDTIFHNPMHPYTRALLRSIPRLGQRTREQQRLASIRGTVPDPYAIPRGCSFHPRCDRRIAGVCDREEPSYPEVEPGHKVRVYVAGGDSAQRHCLRKWTLDRGRNGPDRDRSESGRSPVDCTCRLHPGYGGI